MVDSIGTDSVLVKATAKPSKADFLPSLNGIRAVAILLVLLGHLGGTRGFARLDLGVGDYAHLGVLTFFVLSGFLITRLLLMELIKKGRVALRLFYARRALRLFPASYTFIACVGFLSAVGVLHLRAADLWHAVTYTVNYLPRPAWEIGHFWSLSVQEQFYLLWPLVFLKLGPRRTIWIAAAAIALGPLPRLANRFFLIGTPYHDLEMFPMVADSFATGCVLAHLKDWLEKEKWYLKLFRPSCAIGLLMSVLLLNRYMGYTVVSVFGTSVINLSLAVLIHRSIYCPRDCIGRLLNWKPVTSIGIVSYSLYVWQQLFLNRNCTAWINAFPQNLVFAIGVAIGSYFLLEKPFIRLRRRLRG